MDRGVGQFSLPKSWFESKVSPSTFGVADVAERREAIQTKYNEVGTPCCWRRGATSFDLFLTYLNGKGGYRD